MISDNLRVGDIYEYTHHGDYELFMIIDKSLYIDNDRSLHFRKCFTVKTIASKNIEELDYISYTSDIDRYSKLVGHANNNIFGLI